VGNFPTAGTEASDAQAQGMKLDDPSKKPNTFAKVLPYPKLLVPLTSACATAATAARNE
jgi:hypothetical protein